MAQYQGGWTSKCPRCGEWAVVHRTHIEGMRDLDKLCGPCERVVREDI